VDDDDDDEQPKRNDSIHERRTRYDDESERTSHAAGLQKAHEFRQTEKDIQKQRRDEAQAMVDKHGMGETVYRDDLGRKVAEIEKKKLPQLDETEQARLNKGKVQKLQEARFHQEWKHIQESAFARHADDSRLEQARKDVIRQGDPMAVYAARNQIKARVASGKPERPVYKGPSPKPNRFGIGPGYRWDGVDRGNGFEDKVLASKYSSAHKKEEAYRWSTQDM
jgi:pre-mRNA-splicing factor CWC26